MIDSVKSQSLEDWELIIIDDGSTENVRIDDDPRIHYHRFPENRGIPHGFNYAFTLATGDYVQPLSADEFIEQDKLKTQVEYLDNHPEIGCVWGIPGSFAQGSGKRPEWEQYAFKAHNRSREAWLRTLLNFENIPIGGASMLMRRSIMNDLGGFDPNFFHCSDLEMFIRFFLEHEGRVLPYRWADADQPPGRLTAPSEENTKRFQADVVKLREKHPNIALPVTTGKVTIGIPVYNMAGFVSKALDSALAQTVECHIVVLNDASTDDLEAVLEPYADKIEYFKFDENRGVRAGFNQMVARCETEFYISLAADDWIEPTFVEKALAEFAKDPWLEFVASQTDFIDKDGNPLPQNSNPVQNIRRASNKSREQWLAELYYGNQYFGVGMYRTYALREVEGLNDDGVLCDYDLYLKLLQRENIRVIEENLTHTRIHEGNASIGKLDQKTLRQKYHDIKSRYYAPRPKVIIATPFYEMRGFSPYISSMVQTAKILTANQIEWDWWELSGDSYVDRAKNTLLNKFLEDPSATDLIMIDSDMQWDPWAIIKFMQFPEEIVMASYPQKNSWDRWTALPTLVEQSDGKWNPIGRMLPDGSALIKAEYIAGGLIKINRKCLEKYKEAYPEHVYYDPGADPTTPDRLYTEFFTCERAKNEQGQMLRWGEDRVFGKRMKSIGIDGWIYPNIDVGHYGINAWTGNYDKALRKAS